MTKECENFINLLSRTNINLHDFYTKSNTIEEIYENFDPYDLKNWHVFGLDLNKSENKKITLQTRTNLIKDQYFCIVDIETNGSIKDNGQIIEIGAVKVQDMKIIDTFNTLIKANNIPEDIQKLTGITLGDLENAPFLADVMYNFRIFLGSCVFVAHNANFDYGFIDQTYKKINLGPLLNRKLCTIDLARRTIKTDRYGLGNLKEILGIHGTHHRALNDAYSAFEVFKFSLSKIPDNIKTTEELIYFSKNGPSLKL